MLALPARARRISRDLLPAITAAVVVLVARSSFADHYVVPSGSMLPTVELEDHVVVNKLAYGVRLPFVPFYVFRFNGPSRGDVVVLDAPDTGITLLKRVVGLPGDRVEVRGSQLIVNGQAVPLEEHGDFAYETLGGHRHTLNLDLGGGPDFGPTTLPADSYLVLGDHRGDSRDGRFFGLSRGSWSAAASSPGRSSAEAVSSEAGRQAARGATCTSPSQGPRGSRERHACPERRERLGRSHRLPHTPRRSVMQKT
jgi:signal peptidase I